MSFVYAFQLDDGIKIGKADNHEKRKKQFQTSNKNDIETICLLENIESYTYEQIIHKLLDNYRDSKREIFNCSQQLVKNTFDLMKTHLLNLNKETENNNIIPIKEKISIPTLDNNLVYQEGINLHIDNILLHCNVDLKKNEIIEYITTTFNVNYFKEKKVFINLSLKNKINNQLYNWLNGYVIYEPDKKLTMNDINSHFLSPGEYTRNKMTKTISKKIIKEMDIYICEKYTNEDILYIENYTYQGWKNLKCEIYAEDFYRWWSENIEYSKDSFLSLTDVCNKFYSNEVIEKNKISKLKRLINNHYLDYFEKTDIYDNKEKMGWNDHKLII